MSDEKHCPNCDSILDLEGDNYICHGCGQVYPAKESKSLQEQTAEQDFNKPHFEVMEGK